MAEFGAVLERLLAENLVGAVLLLGYINVWRAWMAERKSNQHTVNLIIKHLGSASRTLQELADESNEP
jgi:hypothetical protein